MVVALSLLGELFYDSLSKNCPYFEPILSKKMLEFIGK